MKKGATPMLFQILIKILNPRGKLLVNINPLMPKSAFSILLWLTPEYFTLANARRFYSSIGNLLGYKGLIGKTWPVGYVVALWFNKLIKSIKLYNLWF